MAEFVDLQLSCMKEIKIRDSEENKNANNYLSNTM